MAYPVTFDITKPSRFTRPNVFIRILGAIIFSIVNWLVVVLLPLYAAFQISSQKEKYLENETVKGWLRSYISMASYVYLLTDEFDGTKDPSFRYEITPGGTPSLGSALLRYIMGIPHMLIISALGSVAGIIWIIGSVMILISETTRPGSSTSTAALCAGWPATPRTTPRWSRSTHRSPSTPGRRAPDQWQVASSQ